MNLTANMRQETLTGNQKSKTIGFYPNTGQQVQQHNKLLKKKIYLEQIIIVILNSIIVPYTDE